MNNPKIATQELKSHLKSIKSRKATGPDDLKGELYEAFAQSQARQTRPNSGGVAEGYPRFDKGGVAIIFYFLRVKNKTF